MSAQPDARIPDDDAPLVPFLDPFAADDDDEPAEPPSLWASFTGFLRDLWQGLR